MMADRARRSAVTQPLPAPLLAEPGVDSAYSPALAGAAEVVGLVRHLAERQGRDDLVEQLDAVRGQLAVERVTVLVVGARGLGKSSVVNALVGAAVSPTGEEPTTVAPVAVRHAPAYGGAVVIDQSGTGRPEPRWRGLAFNEATGLADTRTNPDNQWGLRLVELGVPSPTLARGLVLVDTPPVQEVWSPASLRLVRAAGRAAAVVLVTSAAAPLTAGELDLARVMGSMCRRLVVALNGTNAFEGWQAVAERDELLLEQRGVTADVIPVAALPYWGVGGGVPPGPDAGMQALARHLEDRVLLDTEHKRITRALGEAFWAADRLRMRLHSEREVLGPAAGEEDPVARLRAAAHEAQALCNPGTSWNQELEAGREQLRRDLEQDRAAELDRLRDEAQAWAATVTDAESWTDAHLRLHARLTDAVAKLGRVRKLALRALTRRVTDQFQADWGRIVNSLGLSSEAHALLNPRLDGAATSSPRSLAELPLAPPRPEPAPDVHPAVASFERWLEATATFLADDDAETVARTVGELAARCQQRAIELHRSIVEVRSTVDLLRDLEPGTRERRHAALEEDLERLESLDFRLGPAGSTTF